MKVFNLKHARAWAYAVPLAASLLFQPANQLYAAECGEVKVAEEECVRIETSSDPLLPVGSYVIQQTLLKCEGYDGDWTYAGFPLTGSCDPDHFPNRSLDIGSCECRPATTNCDSADVYCEPDGQ